MDKWREMKRWQRWTIIGVGVFILLAILGSLTAPDEEETIDTASQTTVAPDTTPTTVAVPTTVGGGSATTRATTPAPTTTVAGVTYPGRERADKVAAPNGPIDLSGFTTTVADVARITDDFGRKLICGFVTIRNTASKTQRFSSVDFRLQTSGGDVKYPTLSTGARLESGDLIAGGSKAGRVCWDDPGQRGQYVVIWKPDVLNADRGIWLVTL